MVVCLTDPSSTEIYPLSLHDALPIFVSHAPSRAIRLVLRVRVVRVAVHPPFARLGRGDDRVAAGLGVLARVAVGRARSEEHTSELQSRRDLVCRLLLEKKKKNTSTRT